MQLRFEVGRTYKRTTEIHDRFGGQRQGGISTPTDQPVIFLFTSETGEQYGYQDGPDDQGVFIYTGEGQRGDMQFVRGNSAIRDHAANGKDLLLFKALGKGKGCRFEGVYTCANWEYREGLDVEGNARRAIVFHLVPTDAGLPSDGQLGAQEFEEVAKTLSIEELRERAYQAADNKQGPAGKEAKRTLHARSDAVRRYVLQRANGICEACGKPAPFLRRDGTPYLEPHHTRRLSDGGPDHPRWVGAVCPTCHRLIHYGKGGSVLNKNLEEKLSALEKAPQLAYHRRRLQAHQNRP